PRHRHRRHAAGAPAVGRRRVVPVRLGRRLPVRADRAGPRLAARPRAGRAVRARAVLGRRAHRQRDLRRVRAGGGARLGDGHPRPPRARRGLADLRPPGLRGPRRVDGPARHAPLPAGRGRGVHLRGADRARATRPGLVRHVRRRAVRHRVPAHRRPGRPLRRGAAAGRPRRAPPQPGAARAHAGRHLLGVTAVGDLHPVPLDEFPIHQAPLSLRHVATSDRNFYDRSYLNAHDRTGDVFLVAGHGVYPNLGVADAFVTVRRGDRQWVVRCSDALGDDRLTPAVGPFRIEVVEPLRRLRVVCDTADRGLGVDLRWEASFPAVMEPRHVMLAGARPIIDASRFAQVGTWSGTICVEGEDLPVTPDRWVGTRDRSWGIRPVGEAEPPGRPPDDPTAGLWWLYVPLRFERFALVVVVQEQPDGYRTLDDAVRVWPDGRVEQLGWPEVEIGYRPGTRLPERARLRLRERGGRPLDL